MILGIYMPKTLFLTKREFPGLFKKLHQAYEPIKQNKDNKQSFREFCSKLLLEICDERLKELNIRADTKPSSDGDNITHIDNSSQEESGS